MPGGDRVCVCVSKCASVCSYWTHQPNIFVHVCECVCAPVHLVFVVIHSLWETHFYWLFYTASDCWHLIPLNRLWPSSHHQLLHFPSDTPVLLSLYVFVQYVLTLFSMMPFVAEETLSCDWTVNTKSAGWLLILFFMVLIWNVLVFNISRLKLDLPAVYLSSSGSGRREKPFTIRAAQSIVRLDVN